MERVAIFILGEKNSLKLPEIIKLKKMYKEKKIKILEVIDSKDKINILSLEDYLNENNIDIAKSDIISDKFNLIISSFRVYQNHFQNIIYTYNPEVNLKGDSFFQQLLESNNGIENEKLKSKIYMNINVNNYFDVMEIVHPFKNYITTLDTLCINENVNLNTIVNKCYWLNEEDNIFIDLGASDTEDVKLFLSQDVIEQREVDLNDSEIEIFSFYSLFVLKDSGSMEFKNLLEKYQLKLNESIFKKLIWKIIETIGKTNFTMHAKIVLYELLFPFSEEYHEFFYKEIMQYIYTGQLEWKYWKSLILMFQSLYFQKKLKLNDDVYRAAKEINIALSEIIEQQLNIKYERKPEKDNKKVVITIDQLLSLFHAPTHVFKVQLELLLEQTDYEFHVIVEENMILRKDEYVLEFAQFMGNPSNRTIQSIKELFDDNRVKFYLVDDTSDLVTRVKSIVNLVTSINPKFIFSLSSFSTAQNILYKYFPIINFSFGHEYLPVNAHLYLYKNPEKSIQLSKEFNDNVVIKKYIQPPTIMPRTKNYKREMFGFSETDFIIITSGNRIETEINNELVDCMKKVLEDNSNFKWLLVGSKMPKYMKQTCKQQILEKQIKHIKYATDLFAVNEICDISINPNRIGGGYSVASCISVGVPVLMCNYESDGLVCVGRENTCGDTYENVMEYLLKCYKDKEFKEDLLKRQQQQLQKNGAKDETYVLIDYFNQTVSDFEKNNDYLIGL